MIPEIDFAGRSMRGARSCQEDYYAFYPWSGQASDPEELLLVLADGMGGHSHGQEASRSAVSAFVAEIDCRGSRRIHDTLMQALDAANAAVARVAADGNEAGTTLCAAWASSHSIEWVSVGDSPLFLFRANELWQLNADHSDSTSDSCRNLPGSGLGKRKTTLRSAVMGCPIPEIDFSREPLAIQDGDLLLAASDGVLTLKPEELSQLVGRLSKATALSIVKRILEEIELKGEPHQDNVTIAVVQLDRRAR